MTPGLVDPVLAHGEVGQNEFGFNNVRITYGVNASVHMGDVSIFEASDNVEDGIHFADVRQEFVPETFALTGPLHDARNIDQPNRGVVEYVDSDGATAKGRWVVKPFRITRLVAEWNLRFDGGAPADADALARAALGGAPSRAGERHQYRGFVSVDRSFGGERPDAQIVGDVVDLESRTYGLQRETRIGTFEADLIELFDSEKKL